MKSFIAFCILLFTTVNCDNIYRFDYTYYSDIKGSIKLHLVPEKWLEASHRCETEGSVLAWPRNKKLLARMTATIQAHNISRAYSGIHAIFSKGDYTSVDGIPLAKISIPWLKGEPDNADYDEDCLVLTKDGFFADVNCSKILPYMCYKQHDKITKNKCGNIDPEYEFNEITKNCYKIHRHPQNWKNAYKTCYAEGAHLIIVDNKEEIKIVNRLLHGDGDHGLQTCLFINNIKAEGHAGYYYFWEEFGWHNVHGKLVQPFPGFSKDSRFREPNFMGYCATINRSTMGNKYSVMYSLCERRYPFICEKYPDSLLDNGTLF